MALDGSAIGNVLASAVGAPAAAGGFFAILGGVIKTWALEHLKVNPGAMVAASGSVSGLGTFSTIDTDANQLGVAFCEALSIPVKPANAGADAPDPREKWIVTAGALINHFETYGQANGTGLASGSPCTGAGTIQWSSPVFIPLLSQQLGLSDPLAIIAVDAFSAMLLNYIETNGTVVSISLTGAPLSAPTDGAVTGTGTIA
jgi:hypothetical protein